MPQIMKFQKVKFYKLYYNLYFNTKISSTT